MKSLEKMLNDILIEKDVSQQDLALELEVAPSQLSRWLNGQTTPTRRSYNKIKQLYDGLFNKKTA